MAKIPKIMRSYRLTQQTLLQVRQLADVLSMFDAEAIAWAVNLASDMINNLDPEYLGIE